jgi:hypothetical protein
MTNVIDLDHKRREQGYERSAREYLETVGRSQLAVQCSRRNSRFDRRVRITGGVICGELRCYLTR